jgi:hypothetical protein
MSETGALTGSVVELHAGGELIAATVSAEMEENIQLVRADVIGKKYTLEILEDGHTCRMSIDMLFMAEQDLALTRLVPNGRPTSAQLPGFQAVLLDTEHDRVIARMEGLKCSSRRIRVERGRAVMYSVTLEGTIMTTGDQP